MGHEIPALRSHAPEPDMDLTAEGPRFMEMPAFWLTGRLIARFGPFAVLDIPAKAETNRLKPEESAPYSP
jgi:hypothetical protein